MKNWIPAFAGMTLWSLLGKRKIEYLSPVILWIVKRDLI
jgi:hypothetical protein